MDILSKTKELCRVYGIKPSRTKGQNFLISEDIYNKIIDSAGLKADDVVLEVGPGLGFLTQKLAKKAKKVIAVELDDRLAEVLKTGLISQGIRNVEVLNENVLDLDPIDLSFRRSEATEKSLQCGALKKSKGFLANARNDKEKFGDYKIVANLPYNITSVFLRKFLEIENGPSAMVLMLQKEVAERIVAKPGKMSLLAVSVQFYADPEIVHYVGKENFWPEPEVDSATVKLKVKSKKLKVSEKNFFRLVKIGFSSRRKMLKNNLAAGYQITQKEAEEKIKKAGFDEKIRAQDLGVDDWVKLFGAFN